MLRFVPTLMIVMALALAGCHQQSESVQVEEPYTPLAQMEAEPAASADWYAADSGDAQPAAVPVSEPPVVARPLPLQPADEELDPVGGQTYVVRKGDTLYKLARRFYNDQSRWREIWEANRNRIPDPDQLRVGMKLIIP